MREIFRLTDLATGLLLVVSDRSTDSRPLVVHNIGAGAKVEDILFAFTITGHYRYLPRKG